MENEKQKINWFPYIMAWSKYLGEFLTRAANVGNVIRESFSDIHAPTKDEYYK
jgi:hypothetical protein